MMRFALAQLRANAVPSAVAICAALVVADGFLGAHLLQVPFLQDAVAAGRIFPALVAGCGALVVAADWGEHERSGCRSVIGLLLGRWAAGAAIAAGAALVLSASFAVVTALYLLLGALATVVPRHWWLALPALLYLQLYLPPDLLPR